MEEELFNRFQENERRIQKYGAHVAGLVNYGLNAVVYPFYLLSIQLQMSPHPTVPNYTGKTFQQRLGSFIFERHPGNMPYRPAQYMDYRAAMMGVSLQGIPGFYKGYLVSSLHFYSSLYCRAASTQLLTHYSSEDFRKNRQSRILSEISIASAMEFVLYPLFLVQSRLAAQNYSKNFRVYDGMIDVFAKTRPLELFRGSLASFPKQVILGLWQEYTPMLDYYVGQALGVDDPSSFEMILKELFLGMGGYMMIYPILTAQRRYAIQSNITGMARTEYTGITHCMYSILKSEGISGLFRGFLAHNLALGIWVLAMPTFTQYIWMKYDEQARNDVRDLLGVD